MPLLETALSAGLGAAVPWAFNKLTGNSSGATNVPAMNQAPKSSFFSGTPGYAQQFPRFSPEQQNVLQGLLSKGASQADFAPIEQAALGRFQRQTVPTLAERFSALGGQGTRLQSGGFGQALGSAAAGLEENLAALKSQQGLDLLRLGLQPMFENIYVPGQPSPFGQGVHSFLGSEGSKDFISWLVKALTGKKEAPPTETSGTSAGFGAASPMGAAESVLFPINALAQALGAR